ncbi:MAG: tRNA (adenine-N1)-methyltransferase [Desulfonauticus sp.]|nr:tRNA (adenine-N1)-methyltransferase [Desulfonauticus sp.]
MIQPGTLVMLVNKKGKTYFRTVQETGDIHTNEGVISFEQILEKDFGQTISTHLGKTFYLLRPTLYDLIKSVKRKTQIIYPKDIGYILLKLNLGPGQTIIEAGTGSGALTTALAFVVGQEGKVFSYEQREEFSLLAKENLKRISLDTRVEFIHQDIKEGFQQQGVDAIFLDVRTPWEYLQQAYVALKPGAPIGFLLPTTNQVSTLLAHLEQNSFFGPQVTEILIRHYKPVPERLRPTDQMVAHTGFLIFARKIETQ